MRPGAGKITCERERSCLFVDSTDSGRMKFAVPSSANLLYRESVPRQGDISKGILGLFRNPLQLPYPTKALRIHTRAEIPTKQSP